MKLKMKLQNEQVTWKLPAAEGNRERHQAGWEQTWEAPTREKHNITDVITSTNRLFTKHSDWKLTQFFTWSKQNHHNKKTCTIIWLQQWQSKVEQQTDGTMLTTGKKYVGRTGKAVHKLKYRTANRKMGKRLMVQPLWWKETAMPCHGQWCSACRARPTRGDANSGPMCRAERRHIGDTNVARENAHSYKYVCLYWEACKLCWALVFFH